MKYLLLLIVLAGCTPEIPIIEIPIDPLTVEWDQEVCEQFGIWYQSQPQTEELSRFYQEYKTKKCE